MPPLCKAEAAASLPGEAALTKVDVSILFEFSGVIIKLDICSFWIMKHQL